MFRVLHDLQRSSPTRDANFETEREFPPYFKRSAEMGGKNAPSHLRYCTVARRKHSGSQRQARFGGAQARLGGIFRVLRNMQQGAPKQNSVQTSKRSSVVFKEA
jgi:hypothetical protein